MADRSSAIHPRRYLSARIGGTLLAIALVAPVAGSAASASTTQGPTTEPRTHRITIENMRFVPQELTVKRGDRVVWINKDLFPHTATADTQAFDSGSIEAGASWSRVMDEPGNYAYSCTFHPIMKARLIVQ